MDNYRVYQAGNPNSGTYVTYRGPAETLAAQRSAEYGGLWLVWSVAGGEVVAYYRGGELV